jgi:hypothetical protein
VFDITSSAVSQWGEDMPEGRLWQLKVIRPEWFLNHSRRAGDRQSAKRLGALPEVPELSQAERREEDERAARAR